MSTAVYPVLPSRLVAAGLIVSALALLAGAGQIVRPLPYLAEPALALVAAWGLLARKPRLVQGYIGWHVLAYALVLLVPSLVLAEPIGFLSLVALGLPAVAVAMVVVASWEDYGPRTAPATTVAGAPPLWFTPGTAKLVLMSLATLGLYDLYWHYRNWVLVKARENSTIMPLWRAIFGVLWAWPLFGRIRDSGIAVGMPVLPAGLLAAAYFAAHMLYQLPDPWWLVAFVGVVPLALANDAAARAARASSAWQPNARLSAWNWLALAVGGTVFLAALVGTVALPPR